MNSEKNTLKDLTKLALFTKCLLLAQMFMSLLNIGDDLYLIWVYVAKIKPEEIPIFYEALMSVIDGFQSMIFLLGGIIFLIWTYKACSNARILSEDTMKYSPGWAVGWYFVPIYSLWKPYLAMKEIWIESHKGVNKPINKTYLLGIWWTLWISSNILAQISFNTGLSDNIIVEYLVPSLLNLTAETLSIIMNLVVITIISIINNVQRVKEDGSSIIREL
ncbi:MAG: DUF4328 domain-containing protein [Vampirovibrionia bacterium]